MVMKTIWFPAYLIFVFLHKFFIQDFTQANTPKKSNMHFFAFNLFLAQIDVNVNIVEI